MNYLFDIQLLLYQILDTFYFSNQNILHHILLFHKKYGMLLEAIDTLMEKSVSQDTLDNFKTLILTIQEGLDIIRKIKKTIMENHDDVEEVLIHLNPWYEIDRVY